MALKVGYGCCVGSWDRFTRYVAPTAEGRPLLGLSGQTSIAAAYNDILDAFRYRYNVDIVILQHDDLEITDPGVEAKLEEIFESQTDVGLIGVAGGSARGGLGWWNHDPVGHQRTDAMMIDFGPRTGDVQLIEGSFMAFSRDAIRSIRFEERPGFHGYDEVALQVAAKDMCVVVADIDTHHHTALGFDNEQSHADWLAADRWFRQKWGI